MEKEFSQNQDVLWYLEGRNLFSKILKLPGFLQNRAFQMLGVFRRELSLGDFFIMSLPLSLSKRKKMIFPRYDRFLSEEIKKEFSDCLTDDGGINLLEHKFYGKNYFESLGLIKDVIISDQYHAAEFLKKDSIVIDAGANLGIFSILAAQIVSSGNIYAFEPVEDTYKFLRKNTEEYPRIICQRLGLGDVCAQKDIFVNTRSTGGSVLMDSPFYHTQCDSDMGGDVELVDIITIDDYVEGHNIPSVDFIKIDTEGYEAKILKGAERTIKKFKPIVAMSAYHNANDKNDLPKILKSFCQDYICELSNRAEKDLICHIL